MHASRSSRSFAGVLVASFVSLSAGALLVAGGLLTMFSLQSQQLIIAQNQRHIAHNAATSVSSFVRERFSVMETTAWLTDLLAKPPQRRTDVMRSLLGLQPAFRQILLLDADGAVAGLESRISVSTADRLDERITGEVLAGVRRRTNYLSPVYINPATSEPLVILSVPMTGPLREFQGTLVVEMNLKFMWDLIAGMKVGGTGCAYVVDRRGTLLAYGDMAPVLRGENVGGLEIVDAFTSGSDATVEPGVSWYRGIRGTLVAGTYEALGIPDWAVVTEVPLPEAYRQTLRNIIASFLVVLATALLSAMVVVQLSRTLTAPLIHLTRTAARIASGVRDEVATVAGPREAAGLAEAFNSMTAQLHGSLASLEQEVRERTRAEEEVRNLNASLERRVHERTAQLEAANRELEGFSYSVSHDLRAPLRAVDGFSQIILDDFGAGISPDMAGYLGRIRENVHHMGQLIDDLLRLSRLGRQPLARAPIDMAALVARAWEDLAPERDGRRVELAVGVLPPCTGDAGLLHLALVNLLSNALKFTRRADVAHVRVGWRPPPDGAEGPGVYFVADDGVGFDMRYAGKLFGVFQRLHSVQEFPGTGVGLAIVQRVVQRHGGTVWAEGVPDRGATFSFTVGTAAPPD